MASVPMPGQSPQKEPDVLKQGDFFSSESSAETKEKGRYVAAGILALGVLGGLGSVLRPIFFSSSSSNARKAATRAASGTYRSMSQQAFGTGAAAADVSPFAPLQAASEQAQSVAAAAAAAAAQEARVPEELRAVWREVAGKAIPEKGMSQEEADLLLAELVARLRHLQAKHRERHPLWYGDITPEILQLVAEEKMVEQVVGAAGLPPLIAIPTPSATAGQELK